MWRKNESREGADFRGYKRKGLAGGENALGVGFIGLNVESYR